MVTEAPLTWPEEHRCAAAFTFDVDGESAILQMDPALGGRPAAMEHQAYGPRNGVPRILRELDRLGIKGTFFVPGYTAERYPDTIARIADEGHEVGCHGYLHEPPALLNYEAEKSILGRSVEILERITGKRPVGYRAPLANPSLNTFDLLVEHGFVYDSSLANGDTAFVFNTQTGPLVELPMTFALDDWEQYAFLAEPNIGQLIEPPSKLIELWSGELRATHEEGLLFIGIMHPELSGRPARVRVLAEIANLAESLRNVWLTTALDIATWALETHAEQSWRPAIKLVEPDTYDDKA